MSRFSSRRRAASRGPASTPPEIPTALTGLKARGRQGVSSQRTVSSTLRVLAVGWTVLLALLTPGARAQCDSLNLQEGFFFTSSIWSSNSSASFDGKTLTLTTSGPNPGLSVQQGSQSVFKSQLTNSTLRYQILGSKYLVVLDTNTVAGQSTRRVSLLDFSNWSWVNILTVNASSSTPLPHVDPSPGNAAAFLAYGQDGTQHTSVGIRRSDNGDSLCPLGSIISTGQTTAQITATELVIHYSTAGSSKTKICTRPQGECDVSPSLRTFADVFIGGCPFTPETKQFTIKNIGDDCLTVNSIMNSAPFFVQSTSAPLPAELGANDSMTVTVAFNPTGLGDWNSQSLSVSTTPANGDNALVCRGEAKASTYKASFSATTISFGKHPVGAPAPGKMLTITNTGSKVLDIQVPSLSVSGFTCSGFTGTLGCGDSQSIPLGFTPPSEGPHSAVLNVTSDASGSPHSIQLSGEGCVPNAEISVPPTAPIDFGEIQQGFRTVRVFQVQNPGDASLTFQASISGLDASLFGLPNPAGSVTDAPGTRTYTVLPVSPCGAGASGSGSVVVAVSFFADDTPRLAAGTLTLSGHNATNASSGQTWVFPLSAEITPPIALDVALVVDRSGSMGDPLGTRVKMDAAISASQLFVELLRPDLEDRVSVVEFDHEQEVIVPMTSVSTTTMPTKNVILGRIQSELGPPDGNTAIAGGTMVGVQEILTPHVGGTPDPLVQAVVVLSDGEENTGFEDPPTSGSWYSILGGDMAEPLPATGVVATSPMPKVSGIEYYSIGLGKSSDIDPVQLTALASAGENFLHVDDDLTGLKYFELEKYFTQIFMEVIDMAAIADPMFWIAPGDTHEIEFDILRGDVDAMVVIYDFQGLRLPFYCVSPRGEIMDPVLIPPGFQLRSGATSQARIVEFKFPKGEPDRYAGRWRVLIEHPGVVCEGMPGRKKERPGFLPEDCRKYPDPLLYGIAIGAGSNFRMTPYVTPAPVYVGEPIELTALIAEAGLGVPGCQVTVEAVAPNGAVSNWVLFDDGAHSDNAAGDGEYAREYTNTYVDGTYHFKFRTVGLSRDGEPVVREAFRDKPVLLKHGGGGSTGGGNDGDRPGDGDGGGGFEECCEMLLRELRNQSALLEALLGGGKEPTK